MPVSAAIDFCIHCGDVTARTELDHLWLCTDHWKLAVRFWGRNPDGTHTCPLCEAADTPSSIPTGDGDAHLAAEHNVETRFEFIRERERLLGIPSPGKRGVRVSPGDTYTDDTPQSTLDGWES